MVRPLEVRSSRQGPQNRQVAESRASLLWLDWAVLVRPADIVAILALRAT
jgi:hypothetical protein